MKTKLLLFCLLFLSAGYLFSQDKYSVRIPLIGEDAPSFTTETTKGTLDFPSDYGRKWKIIFSHPRDFTPVCSTEILTLAHMQKDFEELGAKILIVSTDTLEKHRMWVKALEDLSYKDQSPVKINFALADDNNCAISKKYGMLHEPVSTTKDVRGVYIIDPKNKIQAIFFYPMNIGRNMDEIKRTLIALQTSGSGKDRVLTPANWKAGDDVLVPQFPYTENELKANPDLKNSYYNVGPFMWFKKAESFTTNSSNDSGKGESH